MKVKSSKNTTLPIQDESLSIKETNTKENKYQIKQWFNKYSDIIILFSTITTALATAILAWATWSYLDLTQRQLQEIQSQRELSEQNLRIANQAEIAIRSPRKLKDISPLKVEFDIEVRGGSAKNIDIYYILYNRISDVDFQLHMGRDYANLLAGNTRRTTYADLEESRTWVNEAIKSSKDKNFGLFVSVVFDQPRILPNDTVITKCETASFSWISKLSIWDNDSLDEHQNLYKVLQGKKLIPAKVKKYIGESHNRVAGGF